MDENNFEVKTHWKTPFSNSLSFLFEPWTHQMWFLYSDRMAAEGLK